MSTYVDGYVLPLSKDKIEAYRLASEKCGAIWREYGALAYQECIGDDMTCQNLIPLSELAQASEEEVVIFSWIIFQSKEHRDEVNAKVMADPRLAEIMDPANQIFDCKRMGYGGFKTLVQL